MRTLNTRLAVAVLIALTCALGCAQATEPEALPAASVVAASPSAAASAALPGGQQLVADTAAEHTVGDTVRLSGGEFVGDQADLAVLDAVLLPPGGGGTAPRYAFLVEITGLDPEVFPYNLLDFSLFDDQSFEYQPLSSGGQEPRLEFGDLIPGRKVRGWLTFEGPTESSFVELQYAPALALEPALVRVIVPG